MRMIMMKMTTTMVRKKTCNYLLSCHDYIFLTSIVKRIPQKDDDDDDNNDNDGDGDSDDEDSDDNPGLSALYDNGEIEEDEEDAAEDFEPGSDDEVEGSDDDDSDGEEENEPDSKKQKTE